MFAVFSLLATLLFAAPQVEAAPAKSLIVWKPHITSPVESDQWVAGTPKNVTWLTDDMPQQLTHSDGTIVLGSYGSDDGHSEHLDMKNPLAKDFPLSQGWVMCEMPLYTKPSDNYMIVLFGDSGNTSPIFSVVSADSD